MARFDLRMTPANAFQPTRRAMLANPFYLVRRSLFRTIAPAAARVRGSVLDFGCGSKPYANLFTQADSYIGVDIAVSGHDHARSQVDVFYDGRSLPFEDERFDNVVSFETVEHVFNLPEMLAEIRRVIRPGGQLMCTVPFAWDEHEVPYDFARYTSFGIRHLLEQAGFERIEIVRTNGFVEAVAQLAILYLWYITRSRSLLLSRITQLAVIFPATALSALLARVLPRRDSFYSGLLVTARRADGDGGRD